MSQMMLIMYYFELILSVFIGVVFVTLLERKILGLIQFRLGPNKVLLKGLIQSGGDALKLMSKGNVLFYFISLIEYNFLPFGMLFMMMSVWMVMPNSLFDYNNNLLMILCLLSLAVYPIMYGSWFSGSLYSMLGSIRSIAQMVSYEVSMIILIVSLIIFMGSFNLYMCSLMNMGGVFLFFVFLMIMLFSSIMVELGRTPVDLLEGESELVSGFNTEYFGTKFAMVFLSEYGMIIYMSGLFSGLVWGFEMYSLKWGLVSLTLVMLIYWIRSVLPRIRYDKLMVVCWISMLNLCLGMLLVNLGVFMALWVW